MTKNKKDDTEITTITRNEMVDLLQKIVSTCKMIGYTYTPQLDQDSEEVVKVTTMQQWKHLTEDDRYYAIFHYASKDSDRIQIKVMDYENGAFKTVQQVLNITDAVQYMKTPDQAAQLTALLTEFAYAGVYSNKIIRNFPGILEGVKRMVLSKDFEKTNKNSYEKHHKEEPVYGVFDHSSLYCADTDSVYDYVVKIRNTAEKEVMTITIETQASCKVPLVGEDNDK